MSTEPALELKNRIASSWKSHRTRLGTLFTEVHPWAIHVDKKGNVIERPPNLREGGRLKYNCYASDFFNLEIHGHCFLEPDPEISWKVVPAISVYEVKGRNLANQDLNFG